MFTVVYFLIIKFHYPHHFRSQLVRIILTFRCNKSKVAHKWEVIFFKNNWPTKKSNVDNILLEYPEYIFLAKFRNINHYFPVHAENLLKLIEFIVCSAGYLGQIIIVGRS